MNEAGVLDQVTVMRANFSSWRDEYGLIFSLGWNGQKTTGNSLLYTAEAAIVLSSRGALDEVNDFVNPILKCELMPGLFKRHPKNDDQESFDDYYALTTAFAVIPFINHFSVAHDVLSYGLSHWGFWNNVSPGQWSKDAFLARNLHFMAHLYICAKRPVPWLFKQGWFFWMKYQPKWADTQDGWALNWHASKAALGSLLPVDYMIAAKDWQFKFKQRYPGGMAELRAEYFQNKEHPLSKWAIE